MAFDNRDKGKESSFLELLRDLTLSGAKLPPIFSQLIGIHGQWIQGSKAVGETFLKSVKLIGATGKSVMVSVATLVAAMVGNARASDKLRLALSKLSQGKDQKVADKFIAQNPDGDRDAFIEARKAYRETRGTKADKELAAQDAYKKAASQKSREELKQALDEINRKSKEKASAAGDEAYTDTFKRMRARGFSERQADARARREAKAAYDTAFRAAKHAPSNVRLASEAAQKYVSAGSRAASVTGSANFTKLASSSLLRGAMGGAAVSAGTLGLGLLVQGGILAGMDYWERKQKEKEGAMKKELELQTLRNKVAITGIQQESQLRQAAFKAEEEMDRKRFENLRILAESKTKMNEADLAMQERLQNIEKQRLAAQKEVEILRQKVGQAKETRQHYDTYVQQEAQVRDSAQFRGGFLESMKLLFTGGAADRDIVDERGVEVDDSVKAAVGSSGWFKRDQQRALTSILSTAKMAREASMAAVKADFDEFVTAYESFAETISSSTVGAMAPEIAARINKIKEDSEKWTKNSSENQVRFAAGEIYSHSFEENVQAGRILYDKESKHYAYKNEEGITIVIKDESEFNDDRSREGAQAAAIAKQRAEEEQKRLEEERKLAEKLHSYQQVQVALVQEQVKKHEELLKNLRDSVAKNYESDITGLFGAGNRKTGSEITEIMRNRADESMRDTILASRRFSGNAQAAGEYKLQTDINMAGLRDLRKVDSTFHKEYLEQYKKNQTELYALRRELAEADISLATTEPFYICF